MVEKYNQFLEEAMLDESDILFFANSLIEKTNETGTFSENIEIDRFDQLKDHEKDGTPVASLMVVFVSDFGPEGLFRVAKEIEDRFPYLRFSFNKDMEGKSLRYEVKNLKTKL